MKPGNVLDRWIAGKIGFAGQTLRRDDIEDYQRRCLGETLAWVRQRSPFYRHHLGAAADTLPNVAALASLPFTTAGDLQVDALRFLCVSQSAVQRVVTSESSGTTGQPKRLFFTAADQEITIDFFHHGLSLMAGAGDSILIMLPGASPGSVGDLLVTAARRLGAKPVVFGFVRDPCAAVEAVMRCRAHLVIGLPVQMLAVARQGRALGRRIDTLKTVLLCSDFVAESVVGELEREWGADVFQHWGMTELGYGGGVECAAHRGYHLQELDFLFEIVDPRTGQSITNGGLGEIVVTTLTRRGMPLIRYRTGDLSRFLPEPCPCGSPLRRFERIAARKSGRVALGGDLEITIGDLDEVLLGRAGLADFSVRLSPGEPACLSITASQALANGFGRRDGAALKLAIYAALEAVPAIRQARYAGLLTVQIQVQPEPLPPSRGKRVITVDAAA
ncbi:MAG: AMP-binding protein [Azospirillaceae bacterium]|nr:AMP-binding protein [Azospirillaceae bacterium]